MSSAEEQIASTDPADRSAGTIEAESVKTAASKRDPAENQAGDGQLQHWEDRAGLATVAGCLIIAAAGWYLLKELAPLLRPLLLAVFLCCVILPIHKRLIRLVSGVEL